LGYLSEQAGTNLVLQSNDLSTTWANGNSVDTQNYAIGPDGKKTANRLIDNSATGTGEVYVEQDVTVSSGQTTISAYLKADQLSEAGLRTVLYDTDGISYFDLSGGSVVSVHANHDDAGIKPAGNGWYRCWIVFTTTTDLAGRPRIHPTSGGSTSVDLDGTSSILVRDVQVESGSFPTTYTPTGASSATRNADVLTYSAVGNADSFPMTVSAEVTSGLDDAGRIVSVSDGSLDNRANLLISTGYAPQLFVKSATTTVASITSTTSVVPKSTVTVTGVVSANDFELYLNSASTGTPDTAGDAPSGITTIEVGNLTGGSDQLNGTIRNVKIHTKRLNDSQVETL